MQTQNAVVYAGVDVAKATLQLHLQGQQREFGNTPKGLHQLCAQLQKVPRVHVVCEATGGYERALVKALHQGQIPVSVTNPARVRAAAQAQGQRAKTDQIDAQGLTDYGQRYQPEPTPPTSATQDQLVALTQWLKQLIHGRALAKTQAEHHQDPFVRRQHAKLMTHLQSQIEAVEKQIEALLEQDAALQQRVNCLDEIQGVGPRTAWMVLAHMPELGRLNRHASGGLGRPGSLDPGKRHDEGNALYRRRPPRSAPGLVHGRPQRGPLQPGIACSLQAPSGQGKVAQGRPDSRDAQTVDLHESSHQGSPLGNSSRKTEELKTA